MSYPCTVPGPDCKSAIGAGFVLGRGVNRTILLNHSKRSDSRAASTPTGQSHLWGLQQYNRHDPAVLDSAPLENWTLAIQY